MPKSIKFKEAQKKKKLPRIKHFPMVRLQQDSSEAYVSFVSYKFLDEINNYLKLFFESAKSFEVKPFFSEVAIKSNVLLALSSEKEPELRNVVTLDYIDNVMIFSRLQSNYQILCVFHEIDCDADVVQFYKNLLFIPDYNLDKEFEIVLYNPPKSHDLYLVYQYKLAKLILKASKTDSIITHILSYDTLHIIFDVLSTWFDKYGYYEGVENIPAFNSADDIKSFFEMMRV